MLLDSLISEIRCGVEAVASRNWSSVTRYPARSWPGERPGRRIAADRCCPAGRGAEARTAGHRRATSVTPRNSLTRCSASGTGC